MKEIKLPLNVTPYFKSYATHCYYNAILTASDKVANENTAVSVVKLPEDIHEWININRNLNYSIEDDKYIFKADKWNQNMNMLFYKNCSIDDEMEITIEKQIFSSPYSNIKLFFSSIDKSNITEQSDINSLDFGYTIGYSRYFGFYSFGKKDYKFNTIVYDSVFPIKIKFTKKNNDLFFEYSDASGNVLNNKLFTIDETFTPTIKGIGVCLGNNTYFDWLFSNYINLVYTRNKPVKLDFLIDTYKNWQSRGFNYFIDTLIENERDILKTGLTLEQYVKQQLDLGRYVELFLNDLINWKQNDSKSTFFHHNLIYGYNEEKKVFYNLYYQKGKVCQGEFSFENFNSPANKMEDRKIYVARYNPGLENFSLSKKHIIQMFMEYLNNENITFYSNQLDQKDVVFGIDCIKKLIENDIEFVMKDIRIVHLLYERAICNKDRIEYFHIKNFFSDEQYDELFSIINNELDLCYSLQLIIIKMKVRQKYDTEKIKNKLNNLYLLEIDFTKKIIEYLLGEKK